MGNQLTEWMQGQIAVRGPVPFVQFMEWALYHPEWGYYTRDSHKFGKEGDFYTSPGIHPVFAEVIADQIAGKWHAMGEPTPFTLIEFGAGEGKFAWDVLGRLKDEHPALFAAVQYKIVELSPVLRERQKATVASYLDMDKLVWLSETELAAGAPYVGIVVTNELVDAYSVHRV